MNQDEQYTGIIIGLSLDIAKLFYMWENFRNLFMDCACQLIEAFDTVTTQGYESSPAFKYLSGYLSEELENFLKNLDENRDNLAVTSPKKPKRSIQKYPRKMSICYNYIPRTPRNLPYQRRAC